MREFKKLYFGKVGYESKNWNCGIAECGKIDTI